MKGFNLMEKHKYPCDICQSNDLARIPSLSKYTGGDKIFTCKNCGFVFVTERRSSDQVANSWSDEIFATAKNPSSQSEIGAHMLNRDLPNRANRDHLRW